MTQKEYINKVTELEKQLYKVTKEYVNSNKIYNVGDYLKITFPKYTGDIVTRYCKIENIYPEMTRGFLDNKSWPKGELEYFARYAWINKNNDNVYIDEVCYLGPLSHHNNICGYKNIDWKTVNIKIIKESELPIK